MLIVHSPVGLRTSPRCDYSHRRQTLIKRDDTVFSYGLGKMAVAPEACVKTSAVVENAKTLELDPISANEKVAIAIVGDLKDWQKLNVVAFLASSIAIQFPETHGKAFITASKSQYLPFLKHPILIYRADSTEELRRSFQRAKDRNLSIGIYTRPLFATKTRKKTTSRYLK